MKPANPFMLWADSSFIKGRKTEMAEFKGCLAAIAAGRPQGIKPTWSRQFQTAMKVGQEDPQTGVGRFPPRFGMMVLGWHGMGKSTLLLHFREEADREGMLAVYVKAGKNERLEQLIGKLAYEATAAIAEKEPDIIIRAGVARAKTLARFGADITRMLRNKRTGIIFFIDDAHEIMEQEKLFREIRALFGSGIKAGAVLSGNTLPKRMPEYFRIMKLRTFTGPEISEFIHYALGKDHPKMGEACISSITADSEGNPCVVATMCRVIYDRVKENEKMITKGHYLAFFPAIMSTLAREFFGKIYDGIPGAEKEVLAAFAKEGRVMHLSDIAKRLGKRLGVVATLAMRLVERGALVRMERGQYRVFTKLFGRYVIDLTSPV